MNEDGTPEERRAAEALERYVLQLLENRAPEIPPELDRDQLTAYMMAAELSGELNLAGQPSPDVIARVQTRLSHVLAHPERIRGEAAAAEHRLSRRHALVAAAGAAGVLVGVALDQSIPGLQEPQPNLVGPNGRWYDIAAADELTPGSVQRFSAGGVDGYLIKEGVSVYAVSAICTHMGCHINWHDGHARFECLCHGAAFGKDGRVVAGIPPTPLPSIHVQTDSGRVYAWGTQEKTWG